MTSKISKRYELIMSFIAIVALVAVTGIFITSIHQAFGLWTALGLSFVLVVSGTLIFIWGTARSYDTRRAAEVALSVFTSSVVLFGIVGVLVHALATSSGSFITYAYSATVLIVALVISVFLFRNGRKEPLSATIKEKAEDTKNN